MWSGLLVAIVALVPAAANAQGSAGRGPWWLQVQGGLAWPLAPAAFQDGWSFGFGIGGSVRRDLGRVVSVGIEAEFLQFGLGDIEGEDVTGGARRFGRFAVPVFVRLWQHPGRYADRIDLHASLGYAHESDESISGIARPSRPYRADGVAWSLGAAYSRRTFQQTRLILAWRYTVLEMPEETLHHATLLLGAQMPLAGARPGQ